MRIRKISIDDRALVESYLKEFQPQISEHTFTNNFVWRDVHRINLAQFDDAIIFFSDNGGDLTIIGPPVGRVDLLEAVKSIEEIAGKSVAACTRLDGSAISELDRGLLNISSDPANFDYVYRRSDLAELPGRRYHNKRNLIAQGAAQFKFSFEEITEANLCDVKEMMDRWCHNRRCQEEAGLCFEYIAIGELLTNFSSLQVLGGAIRIDGMIEAFTFGEKLNDKTAVIHFEKAMPDFKGLYQIINQEFCRRSLGDFEFVNREQDLGIEGLRKAKESYFPEHLVEKFILNLHS